MFLSLRLLLRKIHLPRQREAVKILQNITFFDKLKQAVTTACFFIYKNLEKYFSCDILFIKGVRL